MCLLCVCNDHMHEWSRYNNFILNIMNFIVLLDAVKSILNGLEWTRMAIGLCSCTVLYGLERKTYRNKNLSQNKWERIDRLRTWRKCEACALQIYENTDTNQTHEDADERINGEIRSIFVLCFNHYVYSDRSRSNNSSSSSSST